MLELVLLSLVSLGMMSALYLSARHNQKTGWRRKRSTLPEDIQESMDALTNRAATATAIQPVADLLRTVPVTPLTPAASLDFSLQLAKLQTTLASQPTVTPETVGGSPQVHAYSAKA